MRSLTLLVSYCGSTIALVALLLLKLKDPHLCRRPNQLIHGPNRQECHRVPKSLSDPLRPALKLRPGPFKTMIRMPELAGGKRFPFDVVFCIGSGQDDGLGAGELEED